MRQADEFAALGGIQRQVVQAGGEGLPGLAGEVATGDLGAAMPFGQGQVGGTIELLACQREDAHVAVQSAFAMQVVERGDQLVQSQVTGSAEHEHVTGNRHGITPGA